MLHILLVLLKIIGFVLLVLFLLILTVVLAVLLVPVRYRLDASYDGKEPDINLKITWLLHLISIHVCFHPGENPMEPAVRVFGIPLGRGEKKAVEEAAENFAEGAGEELSEVGLDILDSFQEAGTSGNRESPGTVGEKTGISGEEPEAGEKSSETNGEEPAGKQKKTLRERLGEISEKGPVLSRKVRDTAEDLRSKKEKLGAFLEDEDYQKLFRLLIRQLKRICRHLAPQRLKLFLRFGFEDPSFTGKLLGLGSMLIPWYGDHVRLEPEFEEQVLEGNAHVKGRIRFGTLLARILRLAFTGGFWKLAKQVLKNSNTPPQAAGHQG